MKMLVVLLLAALFSTPAEGKLVGKCELKTLLEEAELKNCHSRITNEDFVAKIVCHVAEGTGFNTSAVSQRTRPDSDTWTLYGLFQLSDHLICDSGAGDSPNLCDINCSDLIDDNVANDITCLETIKTKFQSGDYDHHKADFVRMIHILFQRECYDVVASTYFADC
ncbi:lysozyme C, milk isozyme-like [Centroberyx affinis]|uniref:lysozyme C, milk isozyme-like n=1 Tax=Centroberyx affinis TaxID=166261 RepID=UPI003A5BC931